MNGAHDMGGMQTFGPVHPERAEPIFHADWEPRVLALTLAMGATGTWNIDMSRAARESLPPAQYLTDTYYEIWFKGLCKLLIEHGLATAEEIEAGKAEAPAAPVKRVFHAADVRAALSRGFPYDRPMGYPARFAAGDAVRAREMNPSTHTRLPRYCRGKRGVIVAVRGAHVFPDAHATGEGEQPRWLYSVRFAATELWGDNTSAASVCVDCWEPYLEPVGEH
jgi:nitrile hydratase